MRPAAPKILVVNGRSVRLTAADRRKNLLDFLREDLDLTGAKRGCGIGVCGACTVLADNRPLRSCRTLVADVLGRRLTTIEELAAPDGSLHPLQRAFIDAGAIQCGYCTPGMVLTAHAFLLKHPEPSRAEARRAISSNLCRCTGYQQIIEAILAAAPAYKKKE
ncbi:MAG: (2Fe-2S)-binding protein [Candidatus Aminicenantes bacterium]|nr:(2Fe-2S)-binding protein [Candidatus Aminicenantes bacterium]